MLSKIKCQSTGRRFQISGTPSADPESLVPGPRQANLLAFPFRLSNNGGMQTRNNECLKLAEARTAPWAEDDLVVQALVGAFERLWQ
jgi:hypothetical protein